LGTGLNGSVYCGPGVGEVERGMWMGERERDGGDGEGIKRVNW
jgi:hypothetical protein